MQRFSTLPISLPASPKREDDIECRRRHVRRAGGRIRGGRICHGADGAPGRPRRHHGRKGALIRRHDRPYSAGVVWIPINSAHFYERGKPGYISLDRRGRRFANEFKSYHVYVPELIEACRDDATIEAWIGVTTMPFGASAWARSARRRRRGRFSPRATSSAATARTRWRLPRQRHRGARPDAARFSMPRRAAAKICSSNATPTPTSASTAPPTSFPIRGIAPLEQPSATMRRA